MEYDEDGNAFGPMPKYPYDPYLQKMGIELGGTPRSEYYKRQGREAAKGWKVSEQPRSDIGLTFNEEGRPQFDFSFAYSFIIRTATPGLFCIFYVRNRIMLLFIIF